MERFFAPCPRGLEPALTTELDALAATEVRATDGGVAFAGLHELAKAIDWKRLFRPDRTIRVDVAATRSPLASLEYATLTIKDAVCDRFRADTGARPSVDKRAPDVRLSAYLTGDEATFYVDTSGEPLFKRGWRRDTDEAPLRENLAAGLLALAGWTPATPLLDPM